MPSTFNTNNNPNCSICDKYERSGILCDICNRWSHTKCNNLTHTDLTPSKILKFCTSCILTIFPFNSKTNYNLTNNKNISNIKNFFTELNSINESNENGVENVAGINCKYYDSE